MQADVCAQHVAALECGIVPWQLLGTKEGLHELAKATARVQARSASSDCRPCRLMSDPSFVSLLGVADHVGPGTLL